MAQPSSYIQGKLWQHAESFIKEMKIHCPEVICQSDRVLESAYEFLEEMCEIVGYFEPEEAPDA